MTQSHEAIRDAVRGRYSDLARGASSNAGCCGDECGSSAGTSVIVPLYSKDETEPLPPEALNASAGCGNPVALASLQPGETVVDFGSGGGIDCFLAARAVGPNGRVIGIDMTPDMLSLARVNAGKLGLSNVEFHLSEMERTPIPDGTADALISNCVINLSPDKDAVFAEAFRVLRPGGRLFVSDIVLSVELTAEVAGDLEQWARCLAGAGLRATYLGRMESVGFGGVAVLSEADTGGDSRRLGARSINVSAIKPA